jgi:hypothetical protein
LRLAKIGRNEQARTKRGEPDGVLSFPLAFANLLGELQLQLCNNWRSNGKNNKTQAALLTS